MVFINRFLFQSNNHFMNLLNTKVAAKYVFLLLFTASAFGQKADSLKREPFWSDQPKDIYDVLGRILNRKFSEESDSLKLEKKKVFYAVLPGVGYNRTIGLNLVVSNNLSFYIGDKRKTNLSTVNSDLEYSLLGHQLLMPILLNVWTNENNLNFLGEWRYFKYPTDTYGLGDDTKENIKDLIDYKYFKFHNTLFKPISRNLYLGFGLGLDYRWGINTVDTKTFFQEYNKNRKTTTSVGFLVNLKYDDRQNMNNPQGGFYGSLGLRANQKRLGSDSKWQSVNLELRKYFKFNSKPYHLLALWSYNSFTFGKNVPYFDLPSLGWDTQLNTGRGYIQGRFRGQNLIYNEAEYRYNITRNGLVGGVVFGNVTSVSNIGSYQFKRFYPGYGTGLRFKMNKASNVNFVFDYTFGTQGSRGFFFDLTEVF